MKYEDAKGVYHTCDGKAGKKQGLSPEKKDRRVNAEALKECVCHRKANE